MINEDEYFRHGSKYNKLFNKCKAEDSAFLVGVIDALLSYFDHWGYQGCSGSYSYDAQKQYEDGIKYCEAEIARVQGARGGVEDVQG